MHSRSGRDSSAAAVATESASSLACRARCRGPRVAPANLSPPAHPTIDGFASRRLLPSARSLSRRIPLQDGKPLTLHLCPGIGSQVSGSPLSSGPSSTSYSTSRRFLSYGGVLLCQEHPRSQGCCLSLGHAADTAPSPFVLLTGPRPPPRRGAGGRVLLSLTRNVSVISDSTSSNRGPSPGYGRHRGCSPERGRTLV